MPIAFKALIAFLSFASAPSRSAYARTQLEASYRECRRYIGESAEQLVIMVKQECPENGARCDPAYGEDLLALMLANLQNKLSPEGGAFYLTELYNEYAVKMVSQFNQTYLPAS